MLKSDVYLLRVENVVWFGPFGLVIFGLICEWVGLGQYLFVQL